MLVDGRWTTSDLLTLEGQLLTLEGRQGAWSGLALLTDEGRGLFLAVSWCIQRPPEWIYPQFLGITLLATPVCY